MVVQTLLQRAEARDDRRGPPEDYLHLVVEVVLLVEVAGVLRMRLHRRFQEYC